MANDKDYSKILDSLKREKIDELSYKSFQSENDGGFDVHLTHWGKDYLARNDYDFISTKSSDKQTKKEKEDFTKKRKDFVSGYFEALVKNLAPEEHAKLKDEYARRDSDESLDLSTSFLLSTYDLNAQELNHYINQSVNGFNETGNPMHFINGVEKVLKDPNTGIAAKYSTKKLTHLLNEKDSAAEILKAANEKYVIPLYGKGLSDAKMSHLAFDSNEAKNFLNNIVNTKSDTFARKYGLDTVVADTYDNGTKRAA
jgi:hypothetical protein